MILLKIPTANQNRLVLLYFIGVNKFYQRDTATVRVYVKDALNYPFMLQEYQRTVKDGIPCISFS